MSSPWTASIRRATSRGPSRTVDLGDSVVEAQRQAGLETLFAECFQQAVFVTGLIADRGKFVPALLLPPAFGQRGYLLVTQLERQVFGNAAQGFF